MLFAPFRHEHEPRALELRLDLLLRLRRDLLLALVVPHFLRVARHLLRAPGEPGLREPDRPLNGLRTRQVVLEHVRGGLAFVVLELRGRRTPVERQRIHGPSRCLDHRLYSTGWTSGTGSTACSWEPRSATPSGSSAKGCRPGASRDGSDGSIATICWAGRATCRTTRNSRRSLPRAWPAIPPTSTAAS